jgi:hypothetical protein
VLPPDFPGVTYMIGMKIILKYLRRARIAVLNFFNDIFINNRNKPKTLERFEYITVLNPRMIYDILELVINKAGSESLATALQGLNEELQNVFFANMDQAKLPDLKKDMTAMSWASQYSISAERGKILDIANAHIKSKRFKFSTEMCFKMFEVHTKSI